MIDRSIQDIRSAFNTEYYIKNIITAKIEEGTSFLLSIN